MDNLFYRPLTSSTPFDMLISASNSTTTELESGDTYKSMELMKYWTEKHYRQVEKLASRLTTKTLGNTVKSIKSWLYNAIQYKKDGTEQLLRSPARSWADREIGVDCKSYSIFASSLLLNLGIKHYFRMIKQVNMRPDQFSHVYVVVPKDQATGSLSKGHFVIDGTIKSNVEPIFTEKHDVYMTHKGLNGIDIIADVSDVNYLNGLNCGCQNGLHGGDIDWNNFIKQTGGLLNTSVTSIFGTQNEKYKARAAEIAAQAALEAEKAKTAAANVQSQTKLLELQLEKSKSETAASIEKQKLANEQDENKGKNTLVMVGIGVAALLAIGTTAIVVSKNKKKSA